MKNSNGKTISSIDQIQPDLIRLGFALYGKSSKHDPDLEKTILRVCSFFPDEIKIYKILISVVLELSNLVHVERLKSLADCLDHHSDESIRTKLGLLILCERMIESGDKRFLSLNRNLVQSLKIHLSKLKEFLSDFEDPYLIQKQGLDQQLSELGLKCARIEKSDSKKHLTRDLILAQNRWLRFRVLIGSNYRADVLYLQSTGQYSTRYEIWKALGSSQETVYRICAELSSYQGLQFTLV